jgi:hypothetical protein
MYRRALAGIEQPMAALAKGEVVGDLRKVGIRAELMDQGLYLLNVVKG